MFTIVKHDLSKYTSTWTVVHAKVGGIVVLEYKWHFSGTEWDGDGEQLEANSCVRRQEVKHASVQNHQYRTEWSWWWKSDLSRQGVPVHVSLHVRTNLIYLWHRTRMCQAVKNINFEKRF